MAGTVDLIRDWATQLDYWEEAALEKVAAGTALTEADYQDLLDLFMQDACLIAKPATHRPPLTFPTKLASVEHGWAHSGAALQSPERECAPSSTGDQIRSPVDHNLWFKWFRKDELCAAARMRGIRPRRPRGAP